MFKVVFLILVECHRLSQADLILVFLTRTLPYARVFDLKVNPLPKLANLFTPVSRMNNVNSFTSNIQHWVLNEHAKQFHEDAKKNSTIFFSCIGITFSLQKENLRKTAFQVNHLDALSLVTVLKSEEVDPWRRWMR